MSGFDKIVSLKNLFGGKKKSISGRTNAGILQEFWLEYWWENLGANTSDDFGIL